jgi:HlyD family secretion protein
VDAPTFATDPLRRGDITLTITATGNLEPINKISVGSELSGTTLEVCVSANDHVTRGQPLAKLDISKLEQQAESSRAAVVSAQAKVEQAEATVKEAEANFARQQELRRLTNGKLPSPAEMDAALAAAARARADQANAKAAVGQARAQVSLVERDLAKSVILSPIDGIVLSRSIQPGQTVAASFATPELFVIAENLDHMRLKVAVAEADIGRVVPGQKASFTVDAWPSRTYAATVLKVAYGSAVTDNLVTYQTELEVDNQDLSLRPGMTATVDIHVAQSQNVFVVRTASLRFDPDASSSALTSQSAKEKSSGGFLSVPPARSSGRPANSDQPKKAASDRTQVWVLRDGRPEPLPVQIGISDGRLTEITGEGLNEGLAVITRAN